MNDYEGVVSLRTVHGLPGNDIFAYEVASMGNVVPHVCRFHASVWQGRIEFSKLLYAEIGPRAPFMFFLACTIRFWRYGKQCQIQG
jgi:hypothetical protein